MLCSDGAIVHAPGHPTDAQMVVSRTGKRPHLVLPSGGLACDDDCPQYKSAKLCSHAVAAAEHNKQLDAFIASYGAIKKIPNITPHGSSEKQNRFGNVYYHCNSACHIHLANLCSYLSSSASRDDVKIASST